MWSEVGFRKLTTRKTYPKQSHGINAPAKSGYFLPDRLPNALPLWLGHRPTAKAPDILLNTSYHASSALTSTRWMTMTAGPEHEALHAHWAQCMKYCKLVIFIKLLSRCHSVPQTILLSLLQRQILQIQVSRQNTCSAATSKWPASLASPAAGLLPCELGQGSKRKGSKDQPARASA